MEARRPKPRRTVAAQLAACADQGRGQPDAKKGAGPSRGAGAQVVPCARHEEREFGRCPCILGQALQPTFSPNVLVRVRSRQHPQLRFYVRAHLESFRPEVKGVSILKEIAENAKLNDREVEIEAVDDDEATVCEVEMILGDHFLSKRDIWHMHMAMMQDHGSLLYSSFDNLRQHCPNSRIEKLTMGPEKTPVFCGLVRPPPQTNVIFKSCSANVFLLVQVSAELWTCGLAGRPYWEVLVECFSTLIKNSIQVTGQDSSGHYLRMVLFGRAATSGGHHEDFYDVFWEGSAKVMPPIQLLAARIRQLCIRLHAGSQVAVREKTGSATDGSEWARPDGTLVESQDIVEASRGNLLECINIVMDHFDQSHLDRFLRVTGQSIVLLTAGNGLIHSKSRDLYELTHRRVVGASASRFQVITVREPPLHVVPWVTWPGGPEPDGPEEHGLSSSPDWLDLAYYPESAFCHCRDSPGAGEWLKSSLLPLERAAALATTSLGTLYVPEWPDESFGLEPHLEPKPRAPRAPLAQRAPRHQPRWRVAGAQLWRDLRFPQLRSYFDQMSQAVHADPVRLPENGYTVDPVRFSTTWDTAQAERISLMQDLVGLRLEVLASTKCSFNNSEKKDEYNGDPMLMYPLRPSLPIKNPWMPQARLIQEALPSLSLTVRTGTGSKWQFKPSELGLTVVPSGLSDSDSELIHRYPSDGGKFLVRRCLVRREPAGAGGSASAQFVECRRVFHQQKIMDFEWNKIDNIMSGSLQIPPALPYPIEDELHKDGNDRCSGWKLRGSLKQHFYTFIPYDSVDRSHARYFDDCLHMLGDRIPIGVDPFEVLEEKGWFRDPHAEECREARQRCIERFAAFKKGLDDLCFGANHSGGPLGTNGRRAKTVGIDIEKPSFAVRRKRSTVNVEEMAISSSFVGSRDWFDIFYDDAYSPPKLFHLVVQWIVCSSVHQVNFHMKLSRLAEENGFFIAQLPISQLFPQPAPAWVWDDDRETNLDRPAFYPRRKLDLPAMSTDRREVLYARLLRCWLQPHLDFRFLFESPVRGFKAHAQGNARWQTQKNIYQRLKGWVLCDEEGICLVALREDNIYMYDNHLVLRDSRKMDAKLLHLDKKWEDFTRLTHEILEDSGGAASPLSPRLRKPPLRVSEVSDGDGSASSGAGSGETHD